MTGHSQITLPFAQRLAGWLPDETLFSWCNRHHQSAVNGLASSTCMQLFGHRTAGSAHDFPSRIDDFVERTGGRLGDAEQVIGGHTLLPYYLAFRGGHCRQESILAMRGPNIGSLKYRLGMLSSGLPADHPLKACAKCMADDQISEGVAYWHRSHQIPTVMVCPAHGIPLLVSRMKVQQIGRFQWVLPCNAGLSEIVSESSFFKLQTSQLTDLLSLARMAVMLADSAPGDFSSPQRLSEVFRKRFTELGLASLGGRISWPLLLAKFDDYVRVFDSLSGMGRRLASSCSTQSAFTRLLGARSLMHPSKYLVWISCFFDDWPEFLNAYQAVNQKPLLKENAQPCNLVASIDNARHGQAIALLGQGKKSLSAIANIVGVDFSTVAAWAAKEGAIPSRRPKKLKPIVLGSVIEGLKSGQNKESLARQHHLSIETITRVLRTEPGLSQLWHHVRYEQRMQKSKAQWLKLISSASGAGVKSLRKKDPANYAWLYRNDRKWLDASNLKYVMKAQRGNYAESRMRRKDTELAQSIWLLSAQSHCSKYSMQISFIELVTALPQLRTCIRQLYRWPYTERVINQVLNVYATVLPNATPYL